jgi:cytochrome P450
LQTAHTSAYVLYNLAENPEAQAKLQDEIDRELKIGEPLDMHTFDKLPYMKAVLKEAQRWVFSTPYVLSPCSF